MLSFWHFGEVSGTSVSALKKLSCLIAFMPERSKNAEKKRKT